MHEPPAPGLRTFLIRGKYMLLMKILNLKAGSKIPPDFM
jgi:hypothetical protein